LNVLAMYLNATSQKLEDMNQLHVTA